MLNYSFYFALFISLAFAACQSAQDEVDTTASKLYYTKANPLNTIIKPDTIARLSYSDLVTKKIGASSVINVPSRYINYEFSFQGTTATKSLLLHKKFTELSSADSLLNFTPQKINLKAFENKNQLTGEEQAIKKINGADNLPGSTVNCFYKDNYNRLWIGTDGGVAIYNGFNFQIVSTENGLTHNYVNCITGGNGDTIFVGTKGGIDVFIGNQHASFNPSFFNKANSNEVNCILPFKNYLLIGTSKGMFILNGKHVLLLTKMDGLPGDHFKDFEVLNQTKIILATLDGGLIELEIEPTIKITNRFQALSINCIKKINQELYLGTANQGTWVVRGDSIFALKSAQIELANSSIFDIINYKDKIALGTFGKGTYYIEEKGLIQLNKIESSLPPFVNALIENTNGDLLIGGADGIFKLDSKFKYRNKNNGLSSSIPISCAFDTMNKLWVSTINGGLSIFSENKIDYLAKKIGLHSNNIMQIVHGKSGKTFLATSGNGVDILSGNSIYNLSKSIGLNIVNANCIFEDKHYNLWIGTNENGLYKWDGTVLLNYGPKQGIKSNCIYGLNGDKDNNLLIGTNGDGLMILKNDTCIETYNKLNGLKNEVVYALCADEKKVFFGTYGGGLYCLKERTLLAKITSANGLSDNSVLSLSMDSSHYLYCATAKGLSVINLKSNPLQITNHSINDGMLADDFFPNAVAYNASSGNISWGCNKLLISSNTSDLVQMDSVYPFLVNYTFGDNKTIHLNEYHMKSNNSYSGIIPEEIKINYVDNKLKFIPGYGGNWFSKNEQAIKYKLIGIDKNWIQTNAVAKTEGIVYTNLSPAKYVLNYCVQQSNGLWSKPIQFSFEILPPWYRTQLAYAFYVLLFIASLWGFAQVRNKQLIKKNQELEGIVMERTKEIVEQKEEIEKSKELVEIKNNELTEKNHEIVQSITYAKRLQEAILPNKSIIDQYLSDYFLIYLPKDIVAGDFYWFEPYISTHKKLLFFAVADCTGHGVPGAMVSVVCSTALNRSLQEFNLHDTGQLLDKTRDLVIETFQKSEDEVKDGMDISLCCLNIETNELNWSGANNPIYIIKHVTKELIEIKANKQPIGKYLEPKPFTTHSILLEKGDCIYIFSDGFADQFGGESGKKFKSSKMKELFISVSTQAMKDQNKIILTAFENWKGTTEQIDDVCVWGVKI